MTYAPNANWTSAIARTVQRPVYYIAIDGLTAKHYSTHAVKSAGTTKEILMLPPKGGGTKLDLIDGRQTVQSAEFELLDVDGEITDLIASEAAGAPVGTLVNRKVTIYGGYADLAETDYAAIFVGRIKKVRFNREQTGYIFTAQDNMYLIAGEIMSNATDTEVTTIRGNLVNVYWAILTGTFSTSDPNFPLDYIATGGGTAAPTGMGIPSALIDTTELTSQRDTWHSDTVVQASFIEPTDGRSYLETEIFRVFQCHPAIGGDGTIGLRFHVPPVAPSTAATLTEDEIIDVRSWERLYGDHLNKFRVLGDYDHVDEEYDTTLYSTETTEDTTNQSTTGETIEYLCESKLLRTEYDGVGLAADLAGRMRMRFLETPVRLVVTVSFHKRDVEQGDVLSVTHARLPDMFTGSVGIANRLMTVLSVAPDYTKGVLQLELSDMGYTRFGVISPGATGDYGAATATDKQKFCWIGDATNNYVGSSEIGYRMI